MLHYHMFTCEKGHRILGTCYHLLQLTSRTGQQPGPNGLCNGSGARPNWLHILGRCVYNEQPPSIRTIPCENHTRYQQHCPSITTKACFPQQTQYGPPIPHYLRRPARVPLKKVYPVLPTPYPMPVNNQKTNVALPYTAKPPLRGNAQSQSDSARKTKLGPRLCIWCDVYGHTYKQCKLKYSVHPSPSLP
jgi:hypothetical protein